MINPDNGARLDGEVKLERGLVLQLGQKEFRKMT